MAFLGPNDILVLEKNNGTVQRIVNGKMLPQPLLDVDVTNQGERGMLGIAVAPKHEKNQPTYVFLYFTEAKSKDGEDVREGQKPLGNRLYRYELADNNTKLVNPKLLLDLPGSPIPFHNGGAITIGPDNNVYVPIGDGRLGTKEKIQKKSSLDGRAGILRVTQNGKPVRENGTTGILDNKFPLNLYYGYGLRNSFGIDFDPVTGKLWDTENGPNFGDEINLVKPGFNSGWAKVQGIWKLNENGSAGNIEEHPRDLVKFGGKGKYSPPEFTWFKPTAGPTAIKFLNSDKLGKQYENDMFVGDFHTGTLYHFDLNKKRNGLVLNGSLADKVANSTDEINKGGIIFGKGFGGITDLQVGPDGYLYLLSLYHGGGNCSAQAQANMSKCIQYSSPITGTIFRIVPKTVFTSPANDNTSKAFAQKQGNTTSL
jgi:glucose/arabinose dehydrogenase